MAETQYTPDQVLAILANVESKRVRQRTIETLREQIQAYQDLITEEENQIAQLEVSEEDEALHEKFSGIVWS